ncbi:MAG: hypothetical protein ACI350_09045 [Prevotella sp.]
MQPIDEYKKAILEAMLKQKDENGMPVMNESKAKELLAILTEEELQQGLPFNTPEEVAELLMCSGL